MVSVVAGDRGGVRTALVDGDLLRLAMQRDGALQKSVSCRSVTFGGEKEVNGVAVAIDRSV